MRLALRTMVVASLLAAGCGTAGDDGSTSPTDAGTHGWSIDPTEDASGSPDAAPGSDTTTDTSEDVEEPAPYRLEIVAHEPTFHAIEDGEQVEIISGFQGGWHLELDLLTEGDVQYEQMRGDLKVTVAERDSGDILSSREHEFEEFFWVEREGGMLFSTQGMILDTDDPDTLVGVEVIVHAETDFYDDAIGTISDTAPIELKNDEDELGM